METIIIDLDESEFIVKIHEGTAIIKVNDNREFFKKWLRSFCYYNLIIIKNDIIGFENSIVGLIEIFENTMEVQILFDSILTDKNSIEIKKLSRERKIENLL